MKTMLLTSQGLDVKEEIIKTLPKHPSQLKLAHITTASRYEKDRSYVGKDTHNLQKMGFDVTELDIAGLKEVEVRESLEDKDVIYVQGGNTFYLLKYAKISGFDAVVKELVDKGVIYIGKSAGSYIICPTIEQSSWTHDHNTVGLKDLKGLAMVPFLLYVHYVSSDKEILKEKIKNCSYDVKIITDDQAILVQDDKYTLVGKGPEIIL